MRTMNLSLEAAMQDDDESKTLEEALSFLADCETSTDWLLGTDAALDLADLGLDGHAEELDEDLELPTLTEQSIPELERTPQQPHPRGPLVVELALSSRDSSPSVTTSCPTSPTGSPTLQPQNPKAKKTKQPRKYSNRARDARREELVYLRQKVEDLQLKLDQLRSAHKPQTASAPFSSIAAPPSAAELKNARVKCKLASMRATKLLSGTPSATFSSVAAPMMSTASPAHLAAVWGDMAQRQALERQKAERENVRLKLVLEKQIKVAKSLERILRKRQNEQVLGGPSKRIRRVSPAPGPDAARDDRADFDMLLSGIDKSRQELDAVFEANGLEIHYRNGPDQSGKVGALTDFVLSSVSGSISASHQMIENVLLSGALKKHL
ncbi:hypothetical protein PHYPSEUDO_009737 [Phytophthora pseudosyringae]|uniref:Uncharacterized protein n=1 Tax=Phytophthora pseudosyringae TaxID=221518 RepID=A0A8T1VBK8_9STRA|nr:hypothetical protein PHYPSEUDO_009737 [Phytophthora pseudosyringae]